MVGSASTVAEQVYSFSASRDGAVLSYWTGIVPDEPQLIWFDRSGRQIGTLGAPISQGNAHISPDGTKVAAEIYDPQISDTDSDIWLYDTARGVKTRFTAKPGTARGPCWSPTGSTWFSAQIGEVISTSMKNPPMGLEMKNFVRVGNWEILPGLGPGWEISSLHDRRQCQPRYVDTPLFGDQNPLPISKLNFLKPRASIRQTESGSCISPTSREATRSTSVQCCRPAGKLLVSPSGGSRPKWRDDGKEIFYLSAAGELMAAQVKAAVLPL